MNRGKNTLSKWSVASQLPMLTFPGQTLIEIAGNNRVLLENHRGVVAYSGTLIRIRTGNGIVSVCGSDLIIECMSRFQLVITGCVHGVTIETGG